MKFGDHLSENIFSPWRFEYIQYTQLKQELKLRQLDHQWSAQDEDWFSQKLLSELAKVLRFVTQKHQELDSRLHYCEQTLRTVSNYWHVDSHYASIQDGLVEILHDLNDMCRFIALNRTGFQKMIKKHDKWTRISSWNKYTNMDSGFQHKQQLLDGLFVKLSQLLDLCRPTTPPITTLLDKNRSLIEPQDAGVFERATEKYWVHPENIAEVKAILLLHLPVLRYKPDTPYQPEESAISSVYFDNTAFDLYNGRLQRSEGAEAIRLRWYGPSTSQDIYVERKTHHAPWREDNASVKDRFRLDEPLVDDYLSGLYTPRMISSGLFQDKKKKSIARDAEFTAQGVFDSIQERHLEPALRCFYNRTAFQHVDDSKLRVSLDTNLAFVREDNNRGNQVRPQGHWRREDAGIDYPFRHLNAEDVSLFPYAILETKIQTHLGKQVPEWLTALTTSHLVHPVPRFSKYLHGASQFFAPHLSTLPWWIDQLNHVDILRPRTGYMGLSRTHSLQSLLIQMDGETYDHAKRNSSAATIVVDEEPEDGENEKLVSSSSHKPLSTTVMMAAATKTPAAMSLASLPSRSGQRAKRIQGWLRKKFIRRSATGGSASRRIAVLPPPSTSRVKVEPKTFFANERTFISWLQFCGLILTISLSLINFGDHIAQLCGGLFLVIAAILAVYALWRYQYRTWQIRNRSTARYDDMYGPAILCILIVAAIIVNFNLRFSQQAFASYGSSSSVTPSSTPFVTGEKL